MALEHSFGTFNAGSLDYGDRKRWRELVKTGLHNLVPRPILLHDDFVTYINDTLNWVPCYNPDKQQAHFGLNHYGITLIFHDGAKVATSIFEGWARLFKLGPHKLHLTGAYTFPSSSAKSGAYEMLIYERDATVNKLLDLARQCRNVAANPGKNFILHLGI